MVYLHLSISHLLQKGRLHILDARPKLNAKANGAVGGGHENISHYENASIKFLDIENIHVMRDCANQFRECCIAVSSVTQWLTAVDNSQYLSHVRTILNGALTIVELIENGGAVMVHCSDGWDRTAQLSGLVCLIMDTYYRTTDGFMVLIEKEWIQSGHKFNDRIGYDDVPPRNERSPVFLQFIDCVWQVTQQFPTAFEFNEFLLLDVLDALYSCRFGTFLFNCEKERKEHRIRELTPSFWEYVQENRSKYINPCYDPPITSSGPTTLQTRLPTVLPVSTATRDIQIWSNYYLHPMTPMKTLSLILLEEYQRLLEILKQQQRNESTDQTGKSLNAPYSPRANFQSPNIPISWLLSKKDTMSLRSFPKLLHMPPSSQISTPSIIFRTRTPSSPTFEDAHLTKSQLPQPIVHNRITSGVQQHPSPPTRSVTSPFSSHTSPCMRSTSSRFHVKDPPPPHPPSLLSGNKVHSMSTLIPHLTSNDSPSSSPLCTPPSSSNQRRVHIPGD